MRKLATYGLDATLFRPFYGAYAALSHRLVQAKMDRAVRLPVPVCSVGNIAFGGTAKTPTVQYLARLMVRWGCRPGVVHRGWRGQLDRKGAPATLVSNGSEVLVEWREAGDEARLHAEELLSIGVPVAVCRDRIEACRLLLDRHDVDILLIDDGFQLTGLARDFDIALIDAIVPFGRADCRQGPLREPAAALARADVVLITRSEAVSEGRIEAIKERLAALVDGLPPVFTARTPVREVRGPDAGPGLAGRRVAAFSGIGNPPAFRETLRSLGCKVAEFAVFPDHYPFNGKDLRNIDRRARRLGAEALVTTGKDAIRLDGNRDGLTLPLHVVEIGLEIDGEERFLEMLADHVTGAQARCSSSMRYNALT